MQRHNKLVTFTAVGDFHIGGIDLPPGSYSGVARAVQVKRTDGSSALTTKYELRVGDADFDITIWVKTGILNVV